MVTWFTDQLRKAGFVCTDRDRGIPRHPARQIDDNQHQRGDIYIPGSAGDVLGHSTIIDVVRVHTHTGQGQVFATQRVPRRPTLVAYAVKVKYTKHFTLYQVIGVGFCAFGASTWANGSMEPDDCRLLRHLSYALTTIDFQSRGLDGTDETGRATPQGLCTAG